MGKQPALPFLLLLGACVGNVGGDVPEDGPAAPPDVTPLDVPASPEQLTGSGFCVALESGETLASVSPEGHAWLAAASGEVQAVRIVDPQDEAAIVSDTLELGTLHQVRAWSGGDAGIVAADGLWRLESLARIQLTPPTASMTTPGLCGDPGHNGFLLADGLLYERRADEHWWVWDPGVADEGAPTELVDFDGDCLDTADTMWLTADDGTLWQIIGAQVYRPVRFASLVEMAATAGMVAVLETDRLWIGSAGHAEPGSEAWQPWVFPGAVPNGLSASGGQLWMASGQQLLRFDGEGWIEVTHPMQSPIVDVAAHAGGTWLIGESEICHVATAPMIRVAGIRPYSRSKLLDYEISVSTESGDAVTARVGDEDAPLSLDAETGAYAGTIRFDTVGWHDVVLSAGETTRVIPVKRLPEVVRSWAEDVQPLYEANCTGSTCHGGSADGPPDLGSYEAWLSYASKIRTRVVDAQNMPPASAKTDDWGTEQVEIIAQWLEGGMLP